MNPDMIYQYPIWAVGSLLVGVAVIGTMALELCARCLLPIELRQRHNDVAAAIFSIIGVTYAVLLAFVATLAWDGFNRAKAATYAEAALVGDVYNLSAGFAEPDRSAIQKKISAYARRVITVEWPEQAEGRAVDQDSPDLDGLNKIVLALHPTNQAEDNLHSLLLGAIERLWDARDERLLAAQPAVPNIVWFVVIVGGAMTVAFGAFLGAPSVLMQLAMSSVLAASGVLVLILIIALSNPFRGDFRVSTMPFEHALARMGPATGQQ